MKDWLVVIVLFIVLSVLTMTGAFYAKNAENQAKEIHKQLDSINVTAQNRCMVQVVLSYPPPISESQFEVVLHDFDTCIKEQTGIVNG